MTTPLPAFNFYVALTETGGQSPVSAVAELAAFVLGGFSEVQGLESEIRVEERRAGGQNDRVFRFPSVAAYPNIVLSRGVGFSEDLYLWHEGFLRGEGRRRNGLIFLAGENRVPIKAWSFENGIPVKWSGPALNASTGALAIEKLEIAHERLTLTLSPGRAAASAAGAASRALGI
ncbi:phage tail protein [Actinoplanes sp. NPDC049596]|uniref:phage tail protein n=1 Tax=unclassified Actinoplanes TaxID=2626549 RepID=UPI0034437F91